MEKTIYSTGIGTVCVSCMYVCMYACMYAERLTVPGWYDISFMGEGRRGGAAAAAAGLAFVCF